MSRHPSAKPFRILGSKQRARVASATTPKEKVARRALIEEQVQAFLDNGGTIKRDKAHDRPQDGRPRYSVRVSEPAWA